MGHPAVSMAQTVTASHDTKAQRRSVRRWMWGYRDEEIIINIPLSPTISTSPFLHMS
jgi:hypothetical protein